MMFCFYPTVRLEFMAPSALPSLTPTLLHSVIHPLNESAALSPSEPKAVEEMKGTDQEYSSAPTQYNSSANSGGEDIELLAFQTVTGQNHLHSNIWKLCC